MIWALLPSISTNQPSNIVYDKRYPLSQLFLHEVNKRVEEKRRLRLEREKLEQEQKDKKFGELKENVDYITGDKEKPFIPILDPKAHALTGSYHRLLEKTRGKFHSIFVEQSYIIILWTFHHLS